MMEGINDESRNSPEWNRILVIVALLSGASSNVGWLTTDTEDRYKGEDAVRDFALRDDRIASIKREFEQYRDRDTARIRELEKELEGLRLRWALHGEHER